MKILKFLKENGWAFWIGFGANVFLDAPIIEWQFWAFAVPLAILVILSQGQK